MTPAPDGATTAENDRAGGWPIARAIPALLAELWPMVFFTLFFPRTNDHTQRDRNEKARPMKEVLRLCRSR